MSTLKTVEPFGDGFISALCPELILFAGLILLIVVPNLGDGKFRIPGSPEARDVQEVRKFGKCICCGCRRSCLLLLF